MPARVLLCLALSPHAPTLATGNALPPVSPFGWWLHQQVAAASRQWPAVAFRRLRFAGQEVRLVLLLRHPAPPFVTGVVVARALQRDTTASARGVGWLAPDQQLWREARTLVWCAIDRRSALIDHRAVLRYDRTRQSNTTATRKNTMFIDHAANHAATSILPPTAFMIWMPVR